MFFNKKKDINVAIEEAKKIENKILLDVRSYEEYDEYHIPNSFNIPVNFISNATLLIKDKTTPLFVFCFSGSRSAVAVAHLNRMGFTNVKNIGGISSYKGEIVKG